MCSSFYAEGLKRRRWANRGFIDLFWRGTLIAEHKSLGRDLPKYIIVSDFARLRIYDLDAGTDRRRNLGAHYTSEENILKLIKPLFLDGLWAEFHAAAIHCGNALQMDWNNVISAEKVDYILGNPPFVGSKFLNDSQREDMGHVFRNDANYGVLDYVTAWYMQAVRYVRGDEKISALLDNMAGANKAPRDRVKVAFVSTNSITQGEQVGALWSALLRLGVKIHFAHRTFSWSNEARGKAAVHCVIIGWALYDNPLNPPLLRGNLSKVIYDYPDIKGESHAAPARNINPYLVDEHDVVLFSRNQPLCSVPEIGIGNKPIDGGNYLFTTEEKDEFLKREPKAKKWFRRWIGSDEFINNYKRWCLWLGDCPPEELRRMQEAMKRVEAVRSLRLASKSAPTRKLADMPTRFHVENIPDEPYLVIPEVSSERRSYIPMGFMKPDTMASNLVKIVPHATLYHFGILTSAMHMAWVSHVCGRLESRYRYSKDIVYNNFPWPNDLTDKQKTAIEQAAQGVLAARAALQTPPSPTYTTLPPCRPISGGRYQALDKAVDAAYAGAGFKPAPAKSDAERVAFLFELYHKYTSLLPATETPAKKRRK